MIYYVAQKPWDEKDILQKSIFPCVILLRDNWDDYGFKTLFRIKYYQSIDQPLDLTFVKILQKDKNFTSLPCEFEQLDYCFCSLGITTEYYKLISNLERNIYTQILEGLNDVVFNNKIAKEFEESEGFQLSLLRSSEAEKNFREGLHYFNNNIIINNDFYFTFKFKASGAVEQHVVNFNFKKHKFLPFRISTIIGKNGTGKTQLLSNLANAMSGLNKVNGSFEPSRPSFSKVITISYSAFDSFKIPESTKEFSYKYCGLKNKEGQIDFNNLKSSIKDSIITISQNSREKDWREIMSKIIASDYLEIIYNNFFNIKEFDSLFNTTSKLSSGQSIIVTIITEVIANIQKESLILFDEPETHLHPNAIANLIRMLYTLLEKFDSYAVISTHSPIILQEIPSRYVNVIERQGDIPSVRKLGIECFGENLSVITNEVFETINIESNYKEWLKKMSEKLSYDQILDQFENELNFNAKIYLKSLSNDKTRK